MSDYSSNFPQQRPKLNLVFNSGSDKLDSRLSYSRSSGGTYLSSEKALNSENLLLQSQDFDTTWANDGGVGLTASQTAPDGTSTAWLLTASSGSSISPRLSQSISISSPTQYTTTVHVKAGTASHAYVSLRGAASNYAYAQLDFASPSSVTTGGAGFTSISGTVTALGSSWYKLTLTATSSSSSSSFAFIGLSDGTAFSGSGYPNWSPAGTETLYAWGAQLSSTNSKVYDSPTTTQISRSYSPLLKTALADAPRLEFASDGQSVAKGLLIESSASNLLPYGHNGFNSGGSFSMNLDDLTASQNAAVSPSGLLDATLLTDTGATPTDHYFSTTISGLNLTTHTLSGYFKKVGTTDSLSFRLSSGGNTYGAKFNFETGYVTAYGSAPDSYTFEKVGNGWVRVSITRALSSSSSLLRINTNLGSVQADDYSGMLFYGLQFEEGSSPSSVLLTSGSALTRASDSCSVVDATLFSSGEHTIIWEGDTDYAPNDKRFFALSDGSMNNRFVADYDNGTATRLRNWADGTNNVGMSTSTVDMTVGTHKLAATLKTNEAQLVVDGTRRQVDTSCVVGGGIDQIGINSSTTGAGPTYNMNGHCKRLTYYNVALSQAEAEALTSNP